MRKTVRAGMVDFAKEVKIPLSQSFSLNFNEKSVSLLNETIGLDSERMAVVFHDRIYPFAKIEAIDLFARRLYREAQEKSQALHLLEMALPRAHAQEQPSYGPAPTGLERCTPGVVRFSSCVGIGAAVTAQIAEMLKTSGQIPPSTPLGRILRNTFRLARVAAAGGLGYLALSTPATANSLPTVTNATQCTSSRIVIDVEDRGRLEVDRLQMSVTIRRFDARGAQFGENTRVSGEAASEYLRLMTDCSEPNFDQNTFRLAVQSRLRSEALASEAARSTPRSESVTN